MWTNTGGRKEFVVISKWSVMTILMGAASALIGCQNYHSTSNMVPRPGIEPALMRSGTGGNGAVSAPAPAPQPSGPDNFRTYDKGWAFDQNGWRYVHIEGSPEVRGRQYGFLVADKLKDVKRSMEYLCVQDTGKTLAFFAKVAEILWTPTLEPEYLAEIKAIAQGAREGGTDITWQEVLFWNGHEELLDYWWPNAIDTLRYAEEPRAVGTPKDLSEAKVKIKVNKDHCSAFMATGSMTADGKIVMAHNSFDNFEWGQFVYVICDLLPDQGHRIVMETAPGWIHSGVDFFVTSAGLMGLETTMGGFALYDEKGAPEFQRIRKAMQYADTLDEAARYILENDNGGYANAWMIGDTNTNEIMLLEDGLKIDAITKKKDGYFIGYNAPLDPRIRNLETTNSGYCDTRRHQGGRQVRLAQLMDYYKGNIDTTVAKKILADHYDVYTGTINPCSRTVDSHYDLDPRDYLSQIGRPEPFRPRGATDGCVGDATLTKEMRFWARYGNSSGIPFDSEAFLKKNIQWNYLKGYLMDRPARPWTLFQAGEKPEN
jgi:hypothetical protein